MATTSPATRSNKILWLSAGLVALAAALLLADTEQRYLKFIESLDDVTIEPLWSRTQEGDEKIILYFDVVFYNASDLPLWVEAINTQLFIDEQYAGAYSITEGRFQVPAGEQRSVPLQATLWRARAQLFREARSGQGRLQLLGRARVRILVGQTALKVFYDVQGTFPL